MRPIHHRCNAAPISGERVREALQMLHDDTKSYIEVNNLGDPWHNQSMKLARDALALPAISETRTAFREQVKSAMAILDFYEGTDEPIRDGGRPKVSIASEDFATILREFRAALPLAAQPGYELAQECVTCSGRGMLLSSKTCSDCAGKGFTPLLAAQPEGK